MTATKIQIPQSEVCLSLATRLMTEDQEKLALRLINNPPPGSELAKAKEFGVDLTLFISTLRRSPTERARSLSDGARVFQITKQTRLSEK